MIPASIGASFRFTSSCSEGSILHLPDGARREDLGNKQKFLDHAFKYGHSWYEHANGPTFGRRISNGSLHLITGCDKSESWGIATFSGSAEECGLSLDFQVNAIGGGGFSFACSEGKYTMPKSRVFPATPDEVQQGKQNQCLFFRSITITIREGPLARFLGPVEASFKFHNRNRIWKNISGRQVYGSYASNSSHSQRSGSGGGDLHMQDGCESGSSGEDRSEDINCMENAKMTNAEVGHSSSSSIDSDVDQQQVRTHG